MEQLLLNFQDDLTFSPAEPRAKTSRLRASAQARRKEAELAHLSAGTTCASFPNFVRELSSGKTSSGVFPQTGGGDFSRFVAEIARLGYGVAWRVLDCQYTRVDCWPMAIPQRRNRVWLVGCADGDIDGAAKILFEPKSVLGDNQPSREMGEANPKRPTSSAGDCYPTIIARTQALSNHGVFGGEIIVAPTLTTAFGSTPNSCEPLEGRIIVEPTAGTQRTAARRLTPLECERLMGYPENYTRIPYLGKPAEQCPDSPRYEACGNGWAINCARWILLGVHRYLTEKEETL